MSPTPVSIGDGLVDLLINVALCIYQGDQQRDVPDTSPSGSACLHDLGPTAAVLSMPHCLSLSQVCICPHWRSWRGAYEVDLMLNKMAHTV